ncbi:MAG: sulfatase-like hydrolase/transferase [Anaerolineae bacterium]|jgi:arylsulfatase A-like enzyme|nr:sulfatase-like hydrolase/transferase [Anaerolineae bacterium]
MKQPNILLLYTDQQRYDTIAALGNPLIKTPNIDFIANSGVSFDRCYTSTPVCIAARCAMVTGLPAHVTDCYANVEMPQEETSFMEVLQSLGYQTHGVGKQHFSPDSHKLWGYDNRDYSEEGGSDDQYRKFLQDNGYGHVDDIHGVRSEYYYIPQPSQLPAHLHNSHWVADRSIDYLKKRDQNKPFFLMSSFIKPHPPFENPVPWNKLYRMAQMPLPHRPENYSDALCYWNHFQNRYKYRDQGFDDNLLRTMKAAYYAAISFVDWNVGRILQALGDEIDDTLILYLSDHGEMLGDFGSFGKRCMLEPAVHVPLLARLPGTFEGGKRISTPTSNLDLFPTFTAIAGDNAVHPHLEGQDLQKIINEDSERDFVYSQYGEEERGLYLITDGVWKYTYSAADKKEWLYNLVFDPQESRNLAYNGFYRNEVERLRKAQIKRYTDAGYTKAVENGDWKDYGITECNFQTDQQLLLQDLAEDLQGTIDALGEGYARQVEFPPLAEEEFYDRFLGDKE